MRRMVAWVIAAKTAFLASPAAAAPARAAPYPRSSDAGSQVESGGGREFPPPPEAAAGAGERPLGSAASASTAALNRNGTPTDSSLAPTRSPIAAAIRQRRSALSRERIELVSARRISPSEGVAPGSERDDDEFEDDDGGEGEASDADDDDESARFFSSCRFPASGPAASGGGGDDDGDAVAK